MKNKGMKILSFIMAVFICFALLPFSAYAVSVDIAGSITINALDSETRVPIKDAKFRIYHIADASVSGETIRFKYTKDFENNGMKLNNLSDVYLSMHLMAYAQKNNLKYTEKTVDDSGRVVFSDLKCGSYLIVPVETENGYLNSSPFIVSIPLKDEISKQWIYNVSAAPKFETDDKEDMETTSISVRKEWSGNAEHPKNVTVTLYKDGIAVETVILSQANNWYYRWDNLDKKHSWSVIETDVPDGYKVSYSFSQMTIIITNTFEKSEGETTKPSTDSPNEETTTGSDKLVQTGQLNWPVPVLAIAGLLLFSLGWAILKFGKKEDDIV